MKAIIACGLIAFGASSAYASLISPSEALSRVYAQSSAQRLPAFSSPSELQLSFEGLRHGVFIFSDPNRGSFVVAAGSDEYPAILGYSDAGVFDATIAPPALLDVIEAFDAQIADGVPCPRSADRVMADVEPLISSKWDQRFPFDLMTPEINGEHCLTGCVATAMAQVMNYWQYPAVGVGASEYYWTEGGKSLSYDFSENPFDYDLMADVYDSNSSDDQNEAVARLMLACGMASKMEYSTSFSGALDVNAVDALSNHFDYNPGMKLLFRDFYRIGEWEKMVHDELSDGRPVLYYGFSPLGGHAYICDGYTGTDGNFFHFNWGWSGVSDGYYRINALDPEYLGSGATATGFNREQSAIFGLEPLNGNEPGEIQSSNMLCFGYFTIGDTSYKRRGNVLFGVGYGILRQGFYNMAATDITCTLGVKLSPIDGGEPIYIGETGTSKIEPGNGVASFSIPAITFPDEGEYIVNPAYRVGNEWIDMPEQLSFRTILSCSLTPDLISFEVEDNSDALIIEELTLSDPVIYLNQPVEISATVWSHNFADEATTLTPVLLKDGIVAGELSPKTVTAPEGEIIEINWNEAFSDVTPGSYDLALISGKYVLVSDLVSVAVLDPGAELSLTTSGTRINRVVASESDTNVISGSSISFSCKLRCDNGFFSGTVNVAISDETGSIIRLLSDNPKDVSLTPEEVVSISLTGNTDGLYSDSAYTLSLLCIPESGEQFAAGPSFPISLPDAPAGITPARADCDNTVYFNLQGFRIDSPKVGEMVIERRGSKSRKTIFKN